MRDSQRKAEDPTDCSTSHFWRKGKAALVHSQRQFLFSIALPLNILLTRTPFNWDPSCGAGEHIRDDVSRWLSEDLPGNISLRSPGQPREIMPVKQSTGAQKNVEEDEEDAEAAALTHIWCDRIWICNRASSLVSTPLEGGGGRGEMQSLLTPPQFTYSSL